MNPVERTIAVIQSRQALHKKIDELPENAELILVSNVRTITDGRPDDHGQVDVVGIHPAILNERVSWLLHTVIAWLFSGVYNRG